jgi:aspartate dehydrogenase
VSGTSPCTRIAVAGVGSVGRELCCRLKAGIPGYCLTAVSGRDHEKAAVVLQELGLAVPVSSVKELADFADVVVECTNAGSVGDVARPVLERGKEVIVLSAAGLLDHPELVELAQHHGGRITVPSGGLAGLDAVGALAEGPIASVKLTTRKPLSGLQGAPGYTEGGEGRGVEHRRCIFVGSAREAAAGFPGNVNVAVALALASVGVDAVRVEIWVDPTVERNVHCLEIEAAAAHLSVTIENVPSTNPRTAQIVALSVVSLLRKRKASLCIGS